MTKKLKVYLLIILGTVGAACALAGCKIGRPGREQVLAGYNAHVTYYANGGYFDDSTTLTVRELYFKNDPNSEGYNENGVPFYDIYEDSDGMKVEYTGYDLEGWYIPLLHTEGKHLGEIVYSYTPEGEHESVYVYPVLNEDGTPVTDRSEDRPVFAREGVNEQILESEIRVVPSDVKVDSTRRVADDESLIVCAVWRPSLKVKYQLVCESGKTYTDKDGKKYKDGDILRTDNFGRGDFYSPSSLQPLKLEGASFVHTYLEEVRDYTEASREKLVAPLDRPEAGEGETVDDIVIYSWYLDGDGWTIVEDKTSAVNMINGLATSNKYYVMNSVDLDGATVSIKNVTSSGVVGISQVTIEGHGFTISNMKASALSDGGIYNYALFGTIGEKADIKDLKLDGITIDISGKIGSRITFYAICTYMHANAKVSGLEISNVTASIKIPQNVNTVVNNADGINSGNWWLFGGESSDEAFLAKHSGIKLSGTNTVTLSIGSGE